LCPLTASLRLVAPQSRLGLFFVLAGPPRVLEHPRRPSLIAEQGRGLIKEQPQPDWCKLDEGEEVRRELVIACSDPATLFDLVEEALNQISGTVKKRAEADWVV